MDWQNSLTCIVILMAGAYLAWRSRRALRGKPGGCGGGCGCSKPTHTTEKQPTLIAPEQLRLKEPRTK
jgi:hypothetical protein